MVNGHTPASILSPLTTDSLLRISLATMRNTTKPTGRKTMMATTITYRGTTEWKVQPTIQRSTHCEKDWSLPLARCLGMMLSGDTIDVLSFQGEPIRDDTFLFLMNAHYETISFLLPGQENIEWQLLLDTATESGFLAEPKSFPSGD